MMVVHVLLRALFISLFVAVLPTAGYAVSYIKPDTSKELFMLEKIPIPVDSMKELSRHLVVLAHRSHEGRPADVRASGQLLALALQLDPTSRSVRETNDALDVGKQIPSPEDSELNQSTKRVRYYNRWLASPEAGASANQLAKLLTDATKTLQPDTVKNADVGDWKGILPALEDYSVTPEPIEDMPERPGADEVNHSGGDESGLEKEDPAEPKKAPETPKSDKVFHITEQTVYAPYTFETRQKYKVSTSLDSYLFRTVYSNKIASVQLTLTPCPPEEKENFTIAPLSKKDRQHRASYRQVIGTVQSLLKSRHTDLPNYKMSVVFSGGAYSSRRNNSSMATALSLMLEASLKNRPLRKDVHICAAVDHKGRLRTPENFWETLAAIRRSDKKGTLIVAAESAALMNQVLVFGEADFFTRWEVFSAKNLDQAVAVSSVKKSSNVTQADELFDSIQKLTQKTDVTKLAVNRAVRTRLSQIVTLAPNHLSAKALLLQGSGKRPMRLSEEALAHELLPTVRKMRSELNSNISPYSIDKLLLKQYHDSARESLDAIERIVDRNGGALYEDAKRLANDLRRLMLVVRRESRDGYSSGGYEKMRTLHAEMLNDSDRLLAKVLVAAGYPGAAKKIRTK